MLSKFIYLKFYLLKYTLNKSKRTKKELIDVSYDYH